MHSGTGGSATSLSLTQYARLIQGLLDEFDCQIILTAGPGESEKAHELAAKIDNQNVVVYDKNKGLVDFAHSTGLCGFIHCGLHWTIAFKQCIQCANDRILSK